MATAHTASPSPAPVALPVQTTWPYLAAPRVIYFTVMLPICALEACLLAARAPAWMKISAALVLLFTVVAWFRGYRRRLIVTARGVTFVRLTSRIDLPWSQVRRVGTYSPGGGVGGPRYLYVSRLDREPAGVWEISEDVVQVQDRPGLMESMSRFAPRDAFVHSGSPVDVS